MNSVQFIHGENGEAIFAVMPIAAYRDLVGGRSGLELEAQNHPLVNEDQTMIKLPYGGLNAYLHVPDLVSYLQKHGITHLAINQRAQVYTAYPENQLMTLDPIIRREFIDDLRYKNTMQATTEVIDALVSTGKFRRCKQRYEGVFTRAVNAIELVD